MFSDSRNATLGSQIDYQFNAFEYPGHTGGGIALAEWVASGS
jgi:hypothetical protein